MSRKHAADASDTDHSRKPTDLRVRSPHLTGDDTMIYDKAADAIAASIEGDEITRCARTDDNISTLTVFCEDTVDGDNESEFWASDWRVHVARP